MTDWWDFAQGAGSGVGATILGVITLRQTHRQEKRTLLDKAADDTARKQREDVEASLVYARLHGSGGTVVMTFFNDSSQAVTELRLLDARRRDAEPGESWRMNAYVVPTQHPYRKVLRPQSKTIMPVWLLDPQGKRIMQYPSHVDYSFRFRDANGHWWLSDHTGKACRIETPADE